MSFKKPVIPVLGPEEGYNRLKRDYVKYHKHLDSFDKGVFKRLMPRSFEGMHVLDLGAGDGRMYDKMKNGGFARFVATDIAKDLLHRHPGSKGVEKVICNLEEPLPFENDEFDFAMAFFLFEHIEHLRDLFEEMHRVLKPGGTWLIGHFLHRREFTFKDYDGEFKIKHQKRSFDDIESFAERAFFEHSFIDVVEDGAQLGRIYRLEKR